MKAMKWMRAALLALISTATFAAGVVTQSGPKYFATPPAPPDTGSIGFVSNSAGNHEYARFAAVPNGFGAAEFTYSMWVRLISGSASSYNFGDAAELTNWSAHDITPYSAGDWWFHGNFLLDGHTNAGSAFYSGTFSLQVVGTGRIRWTFGDGSAADARTGDLHAIQASPSSGTGSLRDSNWHHIVLVRRWDGGSGAILELWIDGSMVDSETTTSRTNMYTTYWDDFAAQAAAQRGWFIGAEKQAAIGDLTQYADFKGDVSEIAFFDCALSSGAIAAYNSYTPSNASCLLDVVRMTNGSGSMVGINGLTLTINNGLGGQTISRSANDPF